MNRAQPIAFDLNCLLRQVRDQGIVLRANRDRIDLWGPKAALTEAFAATLREHKAAILDYLASNAGAQHAWSLPSSDPAAAYEPFPLTDIQRAYWVGRQQAFDLSEVSIHFYTEVDCESLDVDRLERAWNRVVARHDMLRAVVDDEGVQRVLAQVPDYKIVVSDLRAASPKALHATLQTMRAQLSHQVHSSDAWPGFDLQVVRLGDSLSRLCFGQDLLHIDGGSLLLLFDDLCACYADPRCEKPMASLTYRDYALANQAWRDTPSYQTDLAYWREQVKSLPPAPELPTRAPAGLSMRFERHTFDIDAPAFATLKTQAASLGCTPTSYVMTAFSDIVRHWNGGDDYTLNVTLFNRPAIHPDILRIAGDFTSMVLVPIQHLPGETLGARALRLQQTLWRHLNHRLVSGITILDELRKAAGSPDAGKLSVVFTSLLNLGGQGFSSQWLRPLGTPVYTVTQTPQVTLDHQVFENHQGGLTFSWDVIEDLFPPDLVDAMFGAYRELIEWLLADAAHWHTLAPCHTPAAQLALFDRVNLTAQDVPCGDTLRSLFVKAAQAAPTATAIVHGALALNYRSLASAAERLAAVLLGQGVEPGDRVMVFMDKSWLQPVAALGAHAAGAAYVPLDCSSPQLRLQYLLADSGAKLVLMDARSAALWPDGLACQRLVIGDELLAPGLQAAVPLPSPRPEDVSHIIYTSGSTGAPKGVVVEHRQVVNRILDINRRFNVGAGDAMLGITALHHDLSVYDVFGILAAGATLVLPEADSRLNAAHWLDLMARHRVSLWNSVPAFAVMLADQLDDASAVQALPPLRWMILAGDWIAVSLPERIKAHWPALDLIASGGPTETTIWDIWHRVDHVDASWRSIPYGRPLANAQYFVLDKSGQRCPVWVRGELHIAGAGLARGYWNAPQLSATKFLDAHPLGLRLYASGDMGRYLPDGSIEFLGRNDFQVKVNGHRIELGEIERVATAHPGVHQAVAIVHQAKKGPQLRLFVATGQASHEHEHDANAIDRQQAEFTALNVAATDPVERLLQKLEYRALNPAADEGLLPLQPSEDASPRPRSHRAFCARVMPPDALARFLSPLKGLRDASSGEAKFRYASAGGIYPVQVFVHVKSGTVLGMAEGVYRFYPLHHALELVTPGALPLDIHYAHNLPMAKAAPWTVFLVAELQVIRGQYGNKAEPMAYLEAGMMSQVLRAAADATGFGVCQLGDLAFERIADRLRLTPSQMLLTSMVAGKLPEPTLEHADGGGWPDLLQAHLALHLPPQMMPATVVSLPTLPLTANGKVDRQALLAIQVEPGGERGAFVAPEIGFEDTASRVLADMLGVAQVSATANFFDLGANSALLARAYVAIQRDTGVKFPLISLFRFPTLRGLASSLGSTPAAAAATAAAQRAAKQKAALAGRGRATHSSP